MYFDSVVKPFIELFNSAIEKRRIESTVHITTNAGLIDEKMVNDIVQLKITSFQITLDGYREDHNLTRFSDTQKDSYSTIIQNVKTLVGNGMMVTLRINFTKKNIEDSLQIPDEFLDLTENERGRIFFTPQRVWQDQVCRSRTTKLNQEEISTEEERKVMKCEVQLADRARKIGMRVFGAYASDFV